jgi:FAD/FMN-containing dehydrogenase
MRNIFAIFLFALLCVSAEQSKAGISEYHDAVDVVNGHLANIDQMRDSLLCDGADLVLSCGDGICQPEQGETALNCPADCVDSPVKSYDNAMVCSAVRALYEPDSIAQVQELVKYALNSSAGIRVVGSRHTVNDQYCTDGIVISTAKLNRVIGIVKERDGTESVVVEPGVTMGDLAKWLHTKKRSLGYAQLGFRNATVGGATGTGAHGASAIHTDVISNIVRAVTIVDGLGNIREVNENFGPNDAMRAARTHLGLLGAVVRIKLKIVPQFRLHVTFTDDDDQSLVNGAGVFDQIAGCDYALINWFPISGRMLKTCGVQTTQNAEAGAENTLLTPPIPSILTQPFKVVLHYGMCYEPLNEALENLRYLQLKWIPPFRKAGIFGDLSSTSEAVGYSHLMMTSALITPQNKFFTDDWELAVPFSRAQEAIRAVSNYVQSTGLRLPLIGLLLRFARSEDLTLLAHTTSIGAFKKGEPVLFIEIATPAPVGLSDQVAGRINAVYENLARMLIADFEARPHWGKNKDFVFAMQNDLKVYGNNFARFEKVKNEFDPFGLFMTPFAVNAGFR